MLCLICRGGHATHSHSNSGYLGHGRYIMQCKVRCGTFDMQKPCKEPKLPQPGSSPGMCISVRASLLLHLYIGLFRRWSTLVHLCPWPHLITMTVCDRLSREGEILCSLLSVDDHRTTRSGEIRYLSLACIAPDSQGYLIENRSTLFVAV
jgi:hypothetical protein